MESHQRTEAPKRPELATLLFALLLSACSDGAPDASMPQAQVSIPPAMNPAVPTAGGQAPPVDSTVGVAGSDDTPEPTDVPSTMDPMISDPIDAMDPMGMDPMDPSGMDPMDMDPMTMAPIEPVECPSNAPDEFEPQPSVGGGGSQFTDSAHFRIYGGGSQGDIDTALNHLEAAYSCFVETLCWRSSGLSIHDSSDSGPYSKMNLYGVGSLGGAAGQMFSDAGAGASYLRVVNSYLPAPRVTVHEYGHSLTYYEIGWIEQTATGAWWETVANFVADTYVASPICAADRDRHGVAEAPSLIELGKVIGDSHQVIVDGSAGSGNYYQAWPFLTYLTTNPDGYEGLGLTALRDMFRNHQGNNETPLHVLERLVAPVSVQTIVGRYWARMAYLDINHPRAQEAFFAERGGLSFDNLDATGGDTYQVKSGRRPRYFGSNIIPLQGSGDVTVQVTSGAPLTATLAVRASNGSVRYIDLQNGAGQATVASDEEASLVVVNTPDQLIQYDPFQINAAAAQGLDYSVQITGATP